MRCIKPKKTERQIEIINKEEREYRKREQEKEYKKYLRELKKPLKKEPEEKAERRMQAQANAISYSIKDKMLRELP